MRGLGDVVERITFYTGIQWVLKKLNIIECGCELRQQYLNELFPFKK